jgi:hypothetical protein
MSSSISDDGSFVLVDDAGDVLRAGEEHSCLMALEFGPEVADASDELRDWYLLELADAARRMERFPIIAQMLAQQCSPDGEDDAVDEVCEDDDNEEDDSNSDRWMWEQQCSREFSDRDDGIVDDDEWTLESILKRKMGGAHGEWMYLCKWKWYADPTWEARTLLEDEGFGRELDAFDATKRPQQRRSGGVGKSGPPKGLRKPTNFGAQTQLEVLYPGAIDVVSRMFTSMGLSLVRYAACTNPELENRFISALAGLGGGHCPTILFHGTRSVNICSILETSLLVPGNGNNVRVLNGSAYGVGIYTARTPQISTGYTQGCQKMFVCLGAIGPKIQTARQHGDIIVFFDERLVVPLYVVEFREGQFGHGWSGPDRVLMDVLLNSDYAGPLPGHEEVAFGNDGAATPAPLPAGYAASAAAAQTSEHPMTQRPITKKMLRQAPRSVKDLYKMGVLRSRKTSS